MSEEVIKMAEVHQDTETVSLKTAGFNDTQIAALEKLLKHAAGPHPRFDPIRYARRLRTEGKNSVEAQADIHAQAMQEVINANLPSHQDIKELADTIIDLKKDRRSHVDAEFARHNEKLNDAREFITDKIDRNNDALSEALSALNQFKEEQRSSLSGELQKAARESRQKLDDTWAGIEDRFAQNRREMEGLMAAIKSLQENQQSLVNELQERQQKIIHDLDDTNDRLHAIKSKQGISTANLVLIIISWLSILGVLLYPIITKQAGG